MAGGGVRRGGPAGREGDLPCPRAPCLSLQGPLIVPELTYVPSGSPSGSQSSHTSPQQSPQCPRSSYVSPQCPRAHACLLSHPMVHTHLLSLSTVHTTCLLSVPIVHTCPHQCPHSSHMSPQCPTQVSPWLIHVPSASPWFTDIPAVFLCFTHVPSVSPWLTHIPISVPTAHICPLSFPWFTHISSVSPSSLQEPLREAGAIVCTRTGCGCGSRPHAQSHLACPQAHRWKDGTDTWALGMLPGGTGLKPTSDHTSRLSEEQTMPLMVRGADKGHLGLSNLQGPRRFRTVMFAHGASCTSCSSCLDFRRGFVSVHSLDISKAQPSRKHAVKTTRHTFAFQVDPDN